MDTQTTTTTLKDGTEAIYQGGKRVFMIGEGENAVVGERTWAELILPKSDLDELRAHCKAQGLNYAEVCAEALRTGLQPLIEQAHATKGEREVAASPEKKAEDRLAKRVERMESKLAGLREKMAAFKKADTEEG